MDIIFLIITGVVAVHALTHRTKEGERDTVSIAIWLHSTIIFLSGLVRGCFGGMELI